MNRSGRALVWVCLVAALLHGSAPRADAQLTVTAPGTRVNVTAADDWATRSFQDPQDMSQWSDIGWFAYSVDQPASGLANQAYGACTYPSSGTTSCFSASFATNNPNFFILETGNPGTVHLGKTGDGFPIDASLYRKVAIRMRLSGAGLNVTNGGGWNTNSMGRFIWSPNSIYESQTVGGNFFTFSGWNIYIIDLAALPTYPASGTPVGWNGTRRSLRFDPTFAGSAIEVDWIRLVPTGSSQTVSWTGAASVDIYLDDDQQRANGNLGFIVQDGNAVSAGRTGGSFAFQASALAPGNYYVEICPAGANPTTGSCAYAPGFFDVNAQPALTFTSPSPQGSADDFATVQLNDAWDMASLADIDLTQFVAGLTPRTINAVNEAGASLGAVNVLQGTSNPPSQTGWGDPYLYPMWFAIPGRGAYKKIDSNRYHILTFEMGIPNQGRDINGGSIARVVWQVQGQPGLENVSADIIVNHRPGVNVVNTIIADMKTLQLETDPGASPATSGWTGNIESFRVDPHEFTPATPFYIKQVKLAAKEKAVANAYTIRWTYADAALNSLTVGLATMSLYYDTDTNPSNGMTLIASGINPATATSYVWNTAGIPHNFYYIHASFSNGLNSNAAYSRWPIVVDGTNGPPPRFVLSRSLLNFGGTQNGQLLTEPQQVRVNVVGTGGSSVQWRATPIDPSGNPLTQFVTVSPSTGTGSGTVTVSIAPSTAYPNALQGNWAVRIEEVVPGSTWNSAQFVRVFLQMYASTSTTAPVGSFDTPTHLATGLQGSFAVTGWALDDIQVARVEIWRDVASGETTPPFNGPGHPGHGKIFIANAFLVEGARPDVESVYGATPLAYRAGWGYLLLSWGLWAQGNGTYNLYAFAYDNDAHVSTLGTKTISVSNAAATRPFGGIDVPAYGQVMSAPFWNFGWALTPNATPTCTISNPNVRMSIDSGSLVPVTYGGARADIAGAFPGFSNGSNAGGAFYLDTTTLSNGTHTIGWLVTDSCGRTDGIGSRFFTVQNGSGDAAAADALVVESLGVSPAAARASAEPVSVLRSGGRADWVYPSSEGVRVIEIPEGQRVEVQLPRVPGVPFVGAQLVNGNRRALPVGSTLDEAGVFSWQPAAGFLGSYDLWFLSTPDGSSGDAATSVPPVRVRVVVGPPLRMAIDTPAAGDQIEQPFVVAGWALDLAAAEGSGIDTVHVWAYPASGNRPIFLGVAAYGDRRADVGAVYGEQMAPSSFGLLVDRLPGGAWDLVVYAHRAATDRFDAAQVVRVVVR